MLPDRDGHDIVKEQIKKHARVCFMLNIKLSAFPNYRKRMTRLGNPTSGNRLFCKQFIDNYLIQPNFHECTLILKFTHELKSIRQTSAIIVLRQAVRHLLISGIPS
jgi:hypothetical protein